MMSDHVEVCFKIFVNKYRPNSNCLSRWKSPAFMLTSGFLVCCELYGWTKSGHKSSSYESSDDNENEAAMRNEVISEEDFPTLNQWMDDRDVLYKERSRYVHN